MYEVETSLDWHVLQVTKRQTAAKSALELPSAKVGVPYNDFKHYISQYILSTWQDDWNGKKTWWNHLDSTPHLFYYF